MYIYIIDCYTHYMFIAFVHCGNTMAFHAANLHLQATYHSGGSLAANIISFAT